MIYNFLCLEKLLLSNTTKIIEMPTEVTLSLGFFKVVQYHKLLKRFGLWVFIAVGKLEGVCAGKCESWGVWNVVSVFAGAAEGLKVWKGPAELGCRNVSVCRGVVNSVSLWHFWRRDCSAALRGCWRGESDKFWLVQASKLTRLNLLYPLEVINGYLGKSKNKMNLWAILI